MLLFFIRISKSKIQMHIVIFPFLVACKLHPQFVEQYKGFDARTGLHVDPVLCVVTAASRVRR